MPFQSSPAGIPRPRQSSVISIQVLRGLAALAVTIHHAGYDADTIAVRSGLQRLGLERAFDLSFGIHVFFVISGFIMVRTARGFGKPGSWRRFLVRRVVRVVPLYWLMTGLVVIGAALAPNLLNGPADGLPLLLGSFFFVPVARPNGDIQPVLGQGWTLNYEMFFYLLFACAMFLPRRLGLQALAAVLIGLVLCGKVLRPTWPPGILWTDGLLLEFLFGVLIGLVEEADFRLAAPAAISVVLLGAAAALALGPITSRFDALDPWIRQGVPAALVVGGCVLGPVWPSRSAILALGRLGDASYSLYLTHPFTIRVLRIGWSAGMGRESSLWLFVFGSCLAAIGVAFLVFRSIEAPITRSLHARFAETRAVKPPLAAAVRSTESSP